MGLLVRLFEPDINRPVQLEITSTRAQMKAARKKEPIGAGYFADRAPEWLAKRGELCTGLSSATTREQWKAALLAYDQHHGRRGDEYNDRRRAGKEYERQDEFAELSRPVRCYGPSEPIIETARDHGLRCERISLPAWDYVIIKVWATKANFRRAQYAWLQKMIGAIPKTPVVPTQEELEAIDDLFDRSNQEPRQQPEELSLFA